MATDIIPGQLGQKETKKSIGISWHKFKNLEFILADKFQNLEIKKDVLESCMFPILLCGAQTWWLTGKEKKYAQNWTAEGGRENTASCMKRKGEVS
jgi:hypothetical protein